MKNEKHEKRKSRNKKEELNSKEKWKIEKCENSKVLGIAHKIVDDFQGLRLVMRIYLAKSSTISINFSERVFSSRKSTTNFGVSPFS